MTFHEATPLEGHEVPSKKSQLPNQKSLQCCSVAVGQPCLAVRCPPKCCLIHLLSRRGRGNMMNPHCGLW